MSKQSDCNMEKAIKIAIENGWKALDEHELEYLREMRGQFPTRWVDNLYWNMYLLDPLFWQALGKELGWSYDENNTWDNRTWASHWHRFIDHLAGGKDIESFFKSIC